MSSISPDKLAKQFENTLWAVSPVPEWNFTCKATPCPACSRPAISVTVSLNGKPNTAYLHGGIYVEAVEQNTHRMEDFCREFLKPVIKAVDELDEENHEQET